MTEWRTPYRIMVFAHGFRPDRKGKAFDYAFMAWNPVQSYQEARLPSAGSFLYPGIVAARKAAMEFLTISSTRQVSIRTNQDKQVYRYFLHADGTITGYAGTGD